jgi:heme exporter protein D
MLEAVQLGPHAASIIAAYGVTALIVVALIGRAVLGQRAQIKALAELEGRGARRRSERADWPAPKG